MTITPSQGKAARNLLGWSTKQLAENAGIVRTTVWAFESNSRPPSGWCILAIKGALEAAGVVFTNDSEPGVHLSKPE
jgi:DNA-binding XRE family transcriptional regulator